MTDAELYLDSYLESVARSSLLGSVGRPDPVRMRALLYSLARNVAAEAKQSTLASESELSRTTVRAYLDVLLRSFVLEEQPTWSPKLRSAVRKRVSPKWHFVDPSLPTRLLGATPQRLLEDLQTMGFLFESLCIRDLLVYAQPAGASLYHYRDESGLEIDAILQQPGGDWSAFEINLGGQNAIHRAARNLLALEAKVDDSERQRRKSLNVLTAGSVSCQREDGVNVISLGHLAP